LACSAAAFLAASLVAVSKYPARPRSVLRAIAVVRVIEVEIF